VGAHHDQIGGRLPGEVQDHLGGVALRNPPVGHNAAARHRQPVELLLRLLPEELRLGRDDPLAVADHRPREYVQQHEPGLVVAGQRRRQLEGVPGAVREVGRVQDGVDR